MPSPRPSSVLIYACLILCLTIWGATSVVSKITVEHFPVFSTLFLRFCLASLLLVPFFALDSNRRTIKKLQPQKLSRLALLGLIGTSLQMGFFFLGITEASVLDASIILAISPLLICIAGWIFLKESFSLANIIGLSLAALGVMLALTTHGIPGAHSLWGNLGILLSAVAIAAYAIGSKKLNADFTPLQITTVSFLVGMISFAPLALWEYLTHPNLYQQFTIEVIWGIVYLGLVSSVVAYWLYQWALGFATAHKVGVLTFIQPLVGMVLAAIILNESLTWIYGLGTLLTIVGIKLALNQPPTWLGRPRPSTPQALYVKNLQSRG